MTISVTVLYPPPSLSTARVSQDLVNQQHTLLATSVKWLRLKDNNAESCESYLKLTPQRQSTSTEQRVSNVSPEVQHHHFTSTPRTIDTGERKTWNSKPVSFNLTHSVSDIEYAPSASSPFQEAVSSRGGNIVHENHDESITEYLDTERPDAQESPNLYPSKKIKRNPSSAKRLTTSDEVDAIRPENLNKIEGTRLPKKRVLSPVPHSLAYVIPHSNPPAGTANEQYNTDADDEDSNPAPTSLKGKYWSIAIPPSVSASAKSKPTNQPGPQVIFSDALLIPSKTRKPLEEPHFPNETMLHDRTSFTYGGAVDSQSQHASKILAGARGQDESLHPYGREEKPFNQHGQTQQETQYSSLDASAPPATYQSMPLATSTNRCKTSSNEYVEYDLPILNVSSLVHLDHLMQPRNVNPRFDAVQNSIDLLAVIFEVGESKEIPCRTSAKGAAGHVQQNTIRLCPIKICQPRRDGQGGIAVMEVSVWGKLVERIESTQYRLLKGDVVWFKNLQLRQKRGSDEISLQTSTSPESDYRIFYRTFPRDKPVFDRYPLGIEMGTSTEQIDRRLRQIEQMPKEPGARRALSLARWIRELWSCPS